MGQSLSSSSSSNTSAQRNNQRRTANTANNSNNTPSSTSTSTHINNNIHHMHSPQDSSTSMGQANSDNNNDNNNNNSNNASPMQQQQQNQQPSSPSRVLRSTTERRRRNNLFSSFYPLLSRNSSPTSNNTSSNSDNNGNAIPELSSGSGTGSPGPSSNSASGSSSSTARNVSVSWPERPPSRSGAVSPGVKTRLSTRSPGLQPPSTSSTGTSAGRTPRGLSRVQRMYDEQSIRSTRSSSRASSLAAASPPAHPPSSSTTGQAEPAIEYMDIDPESVGVTAQHYQPPPLQSQTRPVMRPSALSQSALSSSSGLVTTDNASTPSTDAAPIRESGPRTRSTTAALQDSTTSSASSTSAASTTTMGSDNHSLFPGLSNPRGGTSISSSLFPIRPDSDDENDDMDRDVVMDRDQQQQQQQHPSSVAQHPQGDTHTQAHPHHQGHTHTHQARRIPGPEFFAQLMMSLHESAATANRTTPSTSSSTPTAAASEDAMGVTPVENGQQDRGSLTGTVEGPTPATPSGRTRLRSSSMRGLFGYQPTNELTGEERPAAADSAEAGVTAGTTGTDAETGTPRGDRNAERFALQIPFFLRLLAEISRMPQGSPDEAGADQTEDATATDRPVEAMAAATTTEGASQQAHPSNPATTTTAPGPSAEPSSENGAPRLRRPNTTIRLIQFGHGVRHPRPSGAPTAPTGTSGPTGATGATAPTRDVQGETEGGEGEAAGPPSEGVNETFIMFLSGPPPEDDTDSSDPAAPGSDDPESARNRARHRAPWVVLTLSGACKLF
ncbi:MAG: hypothetical protein J3R72DRAFT_139183 [Linnemannia gamsii]|nr:MAG: hypothetical protein J3R72DRAFT_139183 [Linnemannia gamsii]